MQGPEEEHGPAKHGVEVLRRQVERQRQQPEQAHAQRGHRAKVGLRDPPELWQQRLRCKNKSTLRLLTHYQFPYWYYSCKQATREPATVDVLLARMCKHTAECDKP